MRLNALPSVPLSKLCRLPKTKEVMFTRKFSIIHSNPETPSPQEMLRSILCSTRLWHSQIVHYPSASIHTSTTNTAGHSKWANIRHIKALKDGQRSLQFIKLARRIRIAIQGKTADVSVVVTLISIQTLFL